MEFVFTLKYQLCAKDVRRDALAERLGAAGCDDALIGTGQPPRIVLEFARAAVDADAAMSSALADVRRALPEARLIEAGPDLVGLTDVALVVGVSRQNMRKLMLTHPASFPPPVHEGNASSVWHLSDVLRWLQSRGSYEMEPQVLAVALSAMQVNLVKEALQIDASRRSGLEALLAPALTSPT